MSSATNVAVWNASFEPLGNTKLGRAMALVTEGRAVIEEEDESRKIRTAGGLLLPYPKVIRLVNYLRVPVVFSEEFWSKSGVLRRDNNRCGYCGKSSKKMSIDHITPRSTFEPRTDADTWLNTISSCTPCNGAKADRTPEQAGMFLMFDPHIPMRMYLKSGKKPSKK